MKALAVVLCSLVAAVAASEHHYPVVQRSADNARELADEIDEMDISFEGSIADIQKLAMDKALQNAPTAAPTEAGFRYSCPGTQIQGLEMVEWDYSIEFLNESDTSVIITAVEGALQDALAPRILLCKNSNGGSIIGVDGKPNDQPVVDATCDAEDEESSCEVYQGRMRLFLEDSSASDAAETLALTEIKDIFSSDAFVDSIGNGLIDLEYLGPNIDSTPVTGGEGGSGQPFNGDSRLGSVSIAMLTIGSAAVVVLVGSAMYMRRERESNNGPMVIDDDTMLGGTTCPPAPSSPFSEMLPSAYRYTEELTVASANVPEMLGSPDSGLSAVAEISSGEEQSMLTAEDQSTIQGSIVVSESGFTADGMEDSISFDMPKSLYLRAPASPLLLGAKKRLDNPVERNANLLGNDSLSEMSTSEDESVNTNLLSITADHLSDDNNSTATSTLNQTDVPASPQQSDLLMDTLTAGILDESAQTDDEALLFL